MLDGELVRRHETGGFARDADEPGHGDRLLPRMQRHRHRVVQLRRFRHFRPVLGPDTDARRRPTAPTATSSTTATAARRWRR